MVQDVSKASLDAVGEQPGEKKPNIFMRVVIFIQQIFAELRKVVTPTRSELLKFTAVVLGFVIVVMAIVYGLDLLFVWLTTLTFGNPTSTFE